MKPAIPVILLCVILIGCGSSGDSATANPPGKTTTGAFELTFKGLKDLEPVDEFYNGGMGGFGSTGTQNFGVTFSSESIAIQSYLQKGAGGFTTPPMGNPALFFSTATLGVVNVPGGFDAGTQFYYAAGADTVVTVWSGANGTGSVLTSATLLNNSGPDNGCPGFPTYCKWTSVSMPFSGTAQSITYSGTPNLFGVADINIGTP